MLKQSSNANIRQYEVKDFNPTFKGNSKSCKAFKVIFGESGREKENQADNVSPFRKHLNQIDTFIPYEQLTQMLSFDPKMRNKHSTHWYQQNGKLVSSIVKVLHTDKPIAQMSEQERQEAIDYLKDFQKEVHEKFFKGCPMIQSAIHMDEKNPHIHIAILNHNGDKWIYKDVHTAQIHGKFKAWELDFDQRHISDNIVQNTYCYGMKRKDYQNMKSYFNNSKGKYHGLKKGYAQHRIDVEKDPRQEIISEANYLLKSQESLLKYENGTNKHLMRIFKANNEMTNQEFIDHQFGMWKSKLAHSNLDSRQKTDFLNEFNTCLKNVMDSYKQEEREKEEVRRKWNERDFRSKDVKDIPEQKQSSGQKR